MNREIFAKIIAVALSVHQTLTLGMYSDFFIVYHFLMNEKQELTKIKNKN